MNAYRTLRPAAFALGCTVVLAGCAGPGPRPDSELLSAASAIEQAEASQARQYEPVLLNQAQNKIADARELLDREEHDRARRLLHQAEVDAQLAGARSETAKARQAVDEINRNIESLRTQMNEADQ